MSLLPPGFWQERFWPDNFFMEDFWPEFGILQFAISWDSTPRLFTKDSSVRGFKMDTAERVFTRSPYLTIFPR